MRKITVAPSPSSLSIDPHADVGIHHGKGGYHCDYFKTWLKFNLSLISIRSKYEG